MANLETALVFVVALNVIMFLGQVTILELNPSATSFFNESGTLIEHFDSGIDQKVLDTGGTSTNLPTTSAAVTESSGNEFTDSFKSIKTWFGKTTGLTYLFSIVSAPYNLLKAMSLPNDFVFAIGTLWYIITLFLVVAFFWQR